MAKTWTAAEEQRLIGAYGQGVVGRDLAAQLGRSMDSVYTKVKRLGLTQPPQPAPVPVEKRARIESLRGEVKMLKADLKKTLLKYAAIEDVRDLLASAIEPVKPETPSFQPPKKWRNKGEFQAVALAGDWQIGEVIVSEETDGGNAFDYAIAQRRVKTYAEEVIKWIETQRSGLVIKTLRVPFMGDLVSGDIHEELSRHNEWPAPVAAVRAGVLAADLVANLAPHAEKVIVEMVGLDNHGRLTKKLQFKMGAFNNWNYVVYHIMALRLARHKNVETVYLPSGVTKRDWPGAGALLMHGHQVRAWMGIPFYGLQRFRGRKAEQELEAALKAAEDAVKSFRPFREIILGHWHCPAWLQDCIVNGCLTGTTELDHTLGRSAAPSQTSFLWHPKYGPFNLVPWKLEGR